MSRTATPDKHVTQAHDWPALNSQVAASASRVVPAVIDLLQPRSVLDVGCGPGHWLRAFQDRGVANVFGVDGPWVTREMLVVSPDHFSAQDLERPLDLQRRFDLAVSLEVGEHLEPSAAPRLVRSLARHSPVILFGAAVPGQTGVGHVNEQWPDYWSDLFRDAGYVGYDWLRPLVWNDPEVCWWYAQNTFLYVKHGYLDRRPDLRQRLEGVASIIRPAIHPRMWDYHRSLLQERSASDKGVLRALWHGVPVPLRQRLRPLLRIGRRGIPPLRGTAPDSGTPRPGSGPPSNLEANLRYWDSYPRIWDQRERLRPLADPESLADIDISQFDVIGDEWGDRQSVTEIVDVCIRPYVTGTSVAGEVGCGGGRVARLVAPLVATLWCFDISPAMLERAAMALASNSNVRFDLLTSAAVPHGDGAFDFLYAFDVFVHLDLHTQWRYLQEFRRLLKPGGRAFLHTSNLMTQAGWRRFASQSEYSFSGFWFTSPDLFKTLVRHAGLVVTEEPSLSAANFYQRRDYLIVVERPTDAAPGVPDTRPPTSDV